MVTNGGAQCSMCPNNGIDSNATYLAVFQEIYVQIFTSLCYVGGYCSLPEPLRSFSLKLNFMSGTHI